MKLLNVTKFKAGDMIEHVKHPIWKRAVISVGALNGTQGYYELRFWGRQVRFPIGYIDDNYRKVEQ